MGDVNQDGHVDILVSRVRAFIGEQIVGFELGAGHNMLFLGTPDGIDSEPLWETEGAEPGEMLGFEAIALGDQTGDGFADLVLSLPGGEEERLDLYLGGAGGPTDRAVASIPNPQQTTGFANSVANAGDVNGDGFTDIIVAHSAADAQTVYLYLGNSTGPRKSPDLTIDVVDLLPQAAMRVGAAGDVNGDGYADIYIQVPADEGRWPQRAGADLPWQQRRTRSYPSRRICGNVTALWLCHHRCFCWRRRWRWICGPAHRRTRRRISAASCRPLPRWTRRAQQTTKYSSS